MNGPSKRLKLALASCVLLAVLEPVAWCVMMFSPSEFELATTGLTSLRFFTVQSNLLLGLASLIYAIYIVRLMRGGPGVPSWAHKLKFVGTVAVTVTLVTVLVFLGPIIGYDKMFTGANFCFHLIFPVLAIVEFVFWDTTNLLPFKATPLGALPTFVYGLGYGINIFVNGVGSGADTNDWYHFTMFGIENIPILFLMMLLFSWLLGVVLNAANTRVQRRLAESFPRGI